MRAMILMYSVIAFSLMPLETFGCSSRLKNSDKSRESIPESPLTMPSAPTSENSTSVIFEQGSYPEIFSPSASVKPELDVAGAKVLRFITRIPCKGICPSSLEWSYMKDGDEWKVIEIYEILSYSEGIKSLALLEKLQENTKYYVRVIPSKMNDEGNLSVNWHVHPPYAPYSLSSCGLTCNEEQEGVRDLLVHYAGPNWLALSWEPPRPECKTHMQYLLRHNAESPMKDKWRVVGAFWSNASSLVEDNVTACSLWPGRHCLIIDSDVVAGRNITVELKVVRTFDRKESREEGIGGYWMIFPPSSPVDLQCVEILWTSLKLRWRCPLQIGGRLTLIHILVEEPNEEEGSAVSKKYKYVETWPEYQYTIEGLQPATQYQVTVWFENIHGLNGTQSILKVKTKAINNNGDQLFYNEEKDTHILKKTATPETGADWGTFDKTEIGLLPWWIWILFALIVVSFPLVFYAGLRWGHKAKITNPMASKRASAKERDLGSLKLCKDVEESGAKSDVETMLPILALPALPTENQSDSCSGYLVPKSLPHECRPINILQHEYEYIRIAPTAEQK